MISLPMHYATSQPKAPALAAADWWEYKKTTLDDAHQQTAVPITPNNYFQIAHAHAYIKIFAFLEAIAWAEGTAGMHGYRYLFGSTHKAPRLIQNFDDHPRLLTTFINTQGIRQRTSAAGKYQFIAPTWDGLAATNPELKSFAPIYQDHAAYLLLSQCGALADLLENNLTAAIGRASRKWASLPNAPFPQPRRTLSSFLDHYEQYLKPVDIWPDASPAITTPV